MFSGFSSVVVVAKKSRPMYFFRYHTVNLQNALHDRARVWLGFRSGLGLVLRL